MAVQEPTGRRHTKLVCTIGPATSTLVGPLIEAGMDVARINFSHGTLEGRGRLCRTVKETAAETGAPVALLADLAGAKIRLGELDGGEIELEAGKQFILRADDGLGDARSASTNHPALSTDLRTGDRVLLADGAAELRVLGCHDGTVSTEVARGGVIRSRAGVNVPSDRLSIPAVTEKDIADVGHALDWGADLVAQSFVRGPADIRHLRQVAGRPLQVVAKIETKPAVDDFDAILEEADAIMLARGDLGVEMAFEELPVLQKDLVRRAVGAGVPMIVATQMLESMVASPRPTRAEASDVANAVLDGTDAILLSAETAIGAHPVEAARTAARIARMAEAAGSAYLVPGRRRPPASEPEAIARAAAGLADSDDRVRAIVCFTRTGSTAAYLAAERPRVPIYAFSPDDHVMRALNLRRGVIPAVCGTPADTDAMIDGMDAGTRERGWLQAGDLAIMVASTPVGHSRTNLMKIHHIGA